MKDLIIPNKVENAINLSEITEDFKGIIIAYNNDKAIGYIGCSDGEWGTHNYTWGLMSSVLVYDYSYEEDSLNNLINKLLKDRICTNFKVIEFY